MIIRFLQTIASENPAFPFQPGQVISVAAPSEYLLSLLDGVHAEAVKPDLMERAVEPETERPEPKHGKGRRREG